MRVLDLVAGVEDEVRFGEGGREGAAVGEECEEDAVEGADVVLIVGEGSKVE